MTVRMVKAGRGRHAAMKTVYTPTCGYASLIVAAAAAATFAASPCVFLPDRAFASMSGQMVTSSRSFTPGDTVMAPRAHHEPSRSGARSVRSMATSVPAGTRWGGIEPMAVPVTRSPGQKKAADRLHAVISGAQQVYESSDGRLDAGDSHLRDDLKKLLDDGSKMLEDPKTTEQRMDGHADSIGRAADAVIAAADRREAAKETAAIAASRAAAREAQPAPSPAVSPRTQAAADDRYEAWLGSHPDAGLGGKVLQYAMTFAGHPYVWGAAGPDAFDCSGLVMYAYAHFGVSLPHYSGAQATMGVEIDPDDILPGDVIANGEHAALYYGKINGEDYVFNALNPSSGVRLTPLRWAFSSPYHIRRMG